MIDINIIIKYSHIQSDVMIVSTERSFSIMLINKEECNTPTMTTKNTMKWYTDCFKTTIGAGAGFYGPRIK